MRRLALAVLAAAPIALLVGSFFDRPGGWLAAAAAAASLPPAAIVLALGRRPTRGAVAAVLALWVLLVGSLAGVVVLAMRPPAGPGPLGLPWGSALAIAGLALFPLVLVSWSYAATFRDR